MIVPQVAGGAAGLRDGDLPGQNLADAVMPHNDVELAIAVAGQILG
jgi:hypothetical protein